MCEDYNESYRCMNGKCVSDLNKCPFIKRLSFIYDIEYTFSIYDSIDFAFDDNGNKIGSLFIPGNAFNMKNKSNLYGKIKVNEISGNLINNISLYPNNSTFIFNISSNIIGSDGVLTYENSVLFNIYTKNNNNEDKKNEKPKIMTLNDLYYQNPENTRICKDEIGKKCLELTNEFRKKNKLPELEWDDEIWRVAYVHSENMGKHKVKFGHAGFNERIKKFRFYFSMAAENVFMCKGYTQYHIGAMGVNGWFNSPVIEKIY